MVKRKSDTSTELENQAQGSSGNDVFAQQRADNIARNRAKMQALGLLSLASPASLRPSQPAPAQAPAKRRRTTQAEDCTATRVSRRLQGAAPAEAPPQPGAVPGPEPGAGRHTARRQPVCLDPTKAVVAPFTLVLSQVTVWELGQIFRGPWAETFWSSHGCLFHHAYPVGYCASKRVFGRDFSMQIAAGAHSPIFEVHDTASGRVYKGNTPTAPWTAACVAHGTGQRISGPLYYGFSELTTQQAVAALYNETELQAAMQLQRACSSLPTAEEMTARELCEIDGIGASVATALALTQALGGSRHASRASLSAWAAQDGGATLRAFLLKSDELPGAVLRWPAWKARWVPTIMQALCPSSSTTEELNAGPHGADGTTQRKQSRQAVAKQHRAPQQKAISREILTCVRPSRCRMTSTRLFDYAT